MRNVSLENIGSGQAQSQDRSDRPGVCRLHRPGNARWSAGGRLALHAGGFFHPPRFARAAAGGGHDRLSDIQFFERSPDRPLGRRQAARSQLCHDRGSPLRLYPRPRLVDDGPAGRAGRPGRGRHRCRAQYLCRRAFWRRLDAVAACLLRDRGDARTGHHDGHPGNH